MHMVRRFDVRKFHLVTFLEKECAVLLWMLRGHSERESCRIVFPLFQVSHPVVVCVGILAVCAIPAPLDSHGDQSIAMTKHRSDQVCEDTKC